ncbi:MAG: hypothetical protein K2K46_01465 [Lachnospiraceae bacterium]|nr:hypothetical protein [Lachnospiraceae bacterium]
MAKKTEYEVHSNGAAANFKDPDDAVNAIWLLGFYHGFEVNKTKAKSALDKHGFYEEFPLSIKKLVYG